MPQLKGKMVMKRVLVNNNIYSIISNHIISSEEVISYINELLVENNLSDLIEHVLITKLDNNMGAYNTEEKTLKINYENIVYYAEYAYNQRNLNMSKQLFIGLYLLMVVAHEITHVIQFSDKESKFYNLFINESNYSANNYSNYLKLHDNFAFEREARINAIENVLELIKENFDENAYEYYFELLSVTLKDGYSMFSSPSTKIKKFVKNTIDINKLDIYDKLKYGFNVKFSELNKFNKNKDSIIIKKLALN